MKILAIGAVYQANDLENTLNPWVQSQKLHDIDIIISAALFKQRQDRGEVFNNDNNKNVLKNYETVKYIETLDPIQEFESRNRVFDFVDKDKYDAIWIVDFLDEYYTVEEIGDTINYLDSEFLSSFYRVNFKNYFGRIEDKTYVLDFTPARILNNRILGGVDKYYWDNDAYFNSGDKTPYTSNEIIPRKICHPKHLSWVGTKEFLKAKIDYQHRAIKCCSYKWDEEKDCLTFDLDYYKRFNLTPPQVFRD